MCETSKDESEVDASLYIKSLQRKSGMTFEEVAAYRERLKTLQLILELEDAIDYSEEIEIRYDHINIIEKFSLNKEEIRNFIVDILKRKLETLRNSID